MSTLLVPFGNNGTPLQSTVVSRRFWSRVWPEPHRNKNLLRPCVIVRETLARKKFRTNFSIYAWYSVFRGNRKKDRRLEVFLTGVLIFKGSTYFLDVLPRKRVTPANRWNWKPSDYFSRIHSIIIRHALSTFCLYWITELCFLHLLIA